MFRFKVLVSPFEEPPRDALPVRISVDVLASGGNSRINARRVLQHPRLVVLPSVSDLCRICTCG